MSNATPQDSMSVDDVMLAMDVVDTLRRDTRLVERELNAVGQDGKLISRLHDIYESQGIDVPDYILKEGVQALREDRFTYVPTPASLSRTLAEWYVNRDKWGNSLMLFVGTVLVLLISYGAFYVYPKTKEIARIEYELTQELPNDLNNIYQQIGRLSKDSDIEAQALQIKENGMAALGYKDLDLARAFRKELKSLSENLRLEYQLRIISGPGSTSGVWRVPDDNPDARNYYLIVEPISKTGEKISLDIINEEDNQRKKVSQYGVRVSQEIFETILNDKRDDGVIQNNIIGFKDRGVLDMNYTLPVLSGVITDW